MIKTGSKFFYSTAAIAFVAAVVYAGSTGDQEVGMDTLLGPLTLGYKGYVGEHVGFTLLMSLAVVALALGAFLSGLRDADAESAAEVAGLETVPEVSVPVTVNYWPIIAGFGAALMAVGLAVDSAYFVVGAAVLAVTTFEWASYAWASRATGDPEVNRSIRSRVFGPLEIPLGSFLGAAVLVLAVSRILLAMPQISGYIIFGVVPVLVMAGGVLVISRPTLPPSAIVGMLALGGLVLIGGGIVAAIAGPTDHGGGEGTHQEETDVEGESLTSLPDPADFVIEVGG